MASVETVSALERRLNASIPQQDIRSQVSARLRNIGRNVKISGFRPGKAPAKVIEQYYGAQAYQDALNDALQRSFSEASEINNLRVAGAPRFEIKTRDQNAEQVEYSAMFEVYPEVVVGDLSGVAIERLVYQLSQDDVNNTIMTLRKQRTKFEKVGRAAQAGDRVTIDFVGKLNGEPFPGGEAKGLPVVLGVGSMLADFEAAVTGMKAGQTKSFDMTFPADYHSKDIAGKQVSFTVTLHGVEEPNLPEIDAEFAKSVGIADGDVSKLEGEIRQNLVREVARRLGMRNKDAVMDALLKVTDFEVPKVLLEKEQQDLMRHAVEDLESRGVKTKGMPFNPELFRERAEKRVKLGLILAALVQKHGLRAEPEQVKAMIEDYAQGFDEAEQIIRWYAAEPGRMLEVENLVLEENVVKWAMGQAKTTDKQAVFAELMGSE
ncbi:MAG: trigger factor [Nitrosomonadales bacterium]|nr:trigger factor [Nitrosomonadales bacterium]